MATIRTRLMAAYEAGIAAYKKGYFTEELDFTDDSEWASRDARLIRYAVFEQYMKNDPYDEKVLKWAKRYKADHGLYEHVRAIANPAKKLVKFHRSHIWGGWLDLSAGSDMESALPIITENERLREAIAQLWQWSNWDTERNQVVRNGVGLGDAFIQVVDDLEKEKVYLKNIHPSKFAEIEWDDFGSIKGYVINYMRTDDRDDSRSVEYTEIAERDGGDVVYTLMKDGRPYPWDGEEKGAEWNVPYGFIPMVHIPHIGTGSGWGESEFQSNLSLFREIDDQRSILNDHIRKAVNYPIKVTGEDAESFANAQFSTPTAARPQPSREEEMMLFLPNPESSMEPMTTHLDINAVREAVNDLKRELEGEYPELTLERISEIGQTSGVAVRRNQQPIARKVDEYRGLYDKKLVHALQMAVSIGGYRELFKGFSLDSYAAGDLNFDIGKRPVFANDPMDDIEIKQGQSEILVNLSGVGNMMAAAEHVYGTDSPLVVSLGQVDILGEPLRDGDNPEGIDARLNGAQITAAAGLLESVTAGEVAESNAVELLVSLEIERSRAVAMARAAVAQQELKKKLDDEESERNQKNQTEASQTQAPKAER